MSSTNRKQERFPTLVAWRRDRGFTLQQAADHLGMPLTTYFEIERGHRRARRDTMVHLLQQTGVAIEFLAGVA